MPFQVINSQPQLIAVIEQCSAAPVRYLDTEFVRERSLYPQFGLLQISDGNQVWLVDPLGIDDLSPLWQWLQQTDQLTVFHAFGEDLELLWHEGKIQFGNILDTQVAAAMLDWGSGMGFAALVERVCGVELDKSHSRTNWLARPLSEQQLQYAADDVHYLVPVAEALITELKAKGLYEACMNECSRLAARKDKSLANRYLDVKNTWQLNRQQLAVLRELAAWRYQRAMAKDMALGFVIKDLALIALARSQPESMAKLKQLNDVSPIEARIHGSKLLSLIADAKKIDKADWPEQIYRVIDIPQYKQRSKALAQLIQQQAEQADIPAPALASKRLINELLMWHWQQPKNDDKPVLLSGWRGQLVGETLTQWLATNC
ncbi:ribonuclease D [Neiella marina]|uniref:Ribonuclease D n=1 Tax=Neiella holothuriorum TaxID=2870530 RepID=A0ABS7ED22_9GAMM|nr:ribonuclease D [Neiella holothuriorum]MBW8190232.1 ribonuclease D [Neiella holothuriorum]